MKQYLLALCFWFVPILSMAQVWIPVTLSDIRSCENYSRSIKGKSFHSSVTWKVTVKDNVISRTKVLFSETFFNANGQPSKIIYFDEANRPKFFTIVIYSMRDLPLEEINFTNDSVMIGGTIYEYGRDNLLMNQISYLGSSVTSQYRIDRMSDTIIVSEVDSLDRVVSRGSISNSTTDQIELVFRKAQNPEPLIGDYDILSEVTHKHIVGIAEKKVFVYDGDKVVKTSVFNGGEEISSASFEYNADGNISRIIERREKDGETNVYMINYR